MYGFGGISPLLASAAIRVSSAIRTSAVIPDQCEVGTPVQKRTAQEPVYSNSADENPT